MKNKITIWIIRRAINWLKTIDDSKLKRELLVEAIKHLYNTVNADDILRQLPDGTWIFKGKPMTMAEVSNLREEAGYLRKMKLWTMIKYDIRYQLGKKMFEEARVQEDLVWGQLLTWLDDCIRNRISKM